MCESYAMAGGSPVNVDMNFCERRHDRVVSADTVTVMTRIRTFAAAAAFGLFLTACGGGETTTESAGAAESESAETFAEVIDTLSGSQLDLGSLEGQDTVLWFWAPW